TGPEISTNATKKTRSSKKVSEPVSSDQAVDAYYEARVSNTVGYVLERDLLSVAPGPYCILYPYDENPGCEYPPYTKDDWEEIHGVNLGLRKK
ncbi:hypothetical protein Tco_0582120, partial [Tanacetum coccineum]